MRRILDLAVQVFGSMKIAQCWMNQPREELDGKAPADHLIQEGKIEFVVQILNKIAHDRRSARHYVNSMSDISF